ncbi:hypothetical protein COY27_00175 [Candidatus Woesearchaeota archaeon CG_4_10_14_0_2_um_filter_33_13]|nr:MAG: hypothetical protein COY27_00175 [Candidatus Woesearchaeota archaeon CG_4_10_14_0_2_um_filter_33_13]
MLQKMIQQPTSTEQAQNNNSLETLCVLSAAFVAGAAATYVTTRYGISLNSHDVGSYMATVIPIGIPGAILGALTSSKVVEYFRK